MRIQVNWLYVTVVLAVFIGVFQVPWMLAAGLMFLAIRTQIPITIRHHQQQNQPRPQPQAQPRTPSHLSGTGYRRSFDGERVRPF